MEIFHTQNYTTFIPDARIMLFGSRVRGDNDKNSDYDVLVVTQKTIGERAKMNWESKIHEALVDAIESPVDITINSENEISFKKLIHGHYLYNAMKDAIEI